MEQAGEWVGVRLAVRISQPRYRGKVQPEIGTLLPLIQSDGFLYRPSVQLVQVMQLLERRPR